MVTVHGAGGQLVVVVVATLWVVLHAAGEKLSVLSLLLRLGG